MNKKMRCMTAFFSVCCILASGSFCGCARETVYRLDGEEISSGQTGEELPVPADAEMTGESVPDAERASSEEGPETIWVYVCGAVQAPGVYELPAESRVFEALAAAGGIREEAELRSLNQAAFLTDGEQITVLTAEEAEAAGGLPAAGPEEGTFSGKVNLNTADREELMTLSGIGEARAAAIIAYREAHGPFASPEEIMNIEGIKEKAFSKIKEEIEV